MKKNHLTSLFFATDTLKTEVFLVNLNNQPCNQVVHKLKYPDTSCGSWHAPLAGPAGLGENVSGVPDPGGSLRSLRDHKQNTGFMFEFATNSLSDQFDNHMCMQDRNIQEMVN